MLFTIVLDFDGTNSVSQFPASDADAAFRKWIQGLGKPNEYGLSVEQAHEVAESLAFRHELHHNGSAGSPGGFDEVTPLMGLKNVWCVATSGGKETRKFVLLNIIATASEKEKTAGLGKKSVRPSRA